MVAIQTHIYIYTYIYTHVIYTYICIHIIYIHIICHMHTPELICFLFFFSEGNFKSSEVLLLRHLGGIFGQPMLVAQVAIAHAERRQKLRKNKSKPWRIQALLP